MKELRYYQQEAVDSLFDYFLEHSGNPLVAIPTAGGKSLVIAGFLRRVFAAYPDQKVLIVTHVKELIAQNFAELKENWEDAPAGIYSAGLKKRQSKHPITFAGIASVAKKSHIFGKVDLMLVDEAHLVGTSATTQYLAFINALKEVNPKLKVIGFTATPYRLGVGCLTEGGIFTDICYNITSLSGFNRLVAEGFLCPLVTKKTYMEFDTTGVKVHGGEFSQKDLQSVVDKDELSIAAVKEMVYYGQDRKRWLVFASGVMHAKHVAEVLRSWGIPAESIYSQGMTTEERDRILNDHRLGKLRALVNCDILTTGYNDPQIDMIGVMRPTKSTVLWVQLLGRGMRSYPGKANCLVLDFAGNTRRLGPVNDPVLPRKKGQGRGGGAAVPVKVCSACYTYCSAACATCPHCGYEFPQNLNIERMASTDDIMASEPAEVEHIVKVDRVVFSEYKKPGKPTSILVSYYCGYNLHREWMCLEHGRGSWATKRGRNLWRTLSNGKPPPDTIDEALCRLGELRAPRYIKVIKQLNNYVEVLGYDFDGTVYPGIPTQDS